MSIEFFGAQLGPKGQGTYIPLRLYYTDPDTHRNTLLISLQYDAYVMVNVSKITLVINKNFIEIFIMILYIMYFLYIENTNTYRC